MLRFRTASLVLAIALAAAPAADGSVPDRAGASPGAASDTLSGRPVAAESLAAESLAAAPAETTTAPATRFLGRVIRARRQIEREADLASTGSLERARLLLSIGRLDEAAGTLDAFRSRSALERIDLSLLRAELHLRRYAFAEAEVEISRVEKAEAGSEEALRLRLALLKHQEDFARIDTLTTRRLYRNRSSVGALLGRAALRYQLLRYDEAEKDYEDAFALAATPENGVAALTGLAKIAQRRERLDEAADLSSQALEAGTADPALLNTIISVLIRLGETAEAIDLAHEVLLWDPWNEEAHYVLGNGYARKSYSELETAYPSAFPDSSTAPLLAQVRGLLEARRRAEARSHLRAIKLTRPSLVDPDLLLGTMYWEEGNPDSAIGHFEAALRICPEYGRAHNAFAKAMESKRLRATVHHDACEREFARAEFPEIPEIERFVSNFASLSARHKKRVALSIGPWARFVPVFVEAGATVYIKPLYERLSETPNQRVLRDLRISYDSRLWDDVRGCGGYHTVTGIEDIERSIFRKYNTLLHELTHQVHYVLTPEEKRMIQDAYRDAKEEDHDGSGRFLSRYQGSSVWEYFAEGMNAYATPMSNRYDMREEVRERLEELDPDLRYLIQKILSDTSIAKYYVPAYVVSAYDRIENGRPEEAQGLLRKALDRSPADEGALGALAYTYLLLGDRARAISTAEAAVKSHPTSPEPWIENARAVFHETGSWSDEIAVLLKGREQVDRSQRFRIELALGEAFLGRGDLERSKEAYLWVLKYQADNPEALWGLAKAHGLASDTIAANELFLKAVRERNGVSELRADYARFLARHGRFDEAERQIEAARLLEPRGSDAEAAAGLLAIYRGDWLEARRRLADALAFAPYNDLATVLLAHTWIATRDAMRAEEILRPVLAAAEKGTPPELLYLEKKGEYRAIHTYPAEERWLLYRTAAELAEAKGDTEGAERYRRLTEQTFR